MRYAIPWPRVLAEGLIIVVSILLAFSIDAGWEARQERKEFESVLVGLEDEFREYVETLDRYVDRSDVTLRQLSYLFEGPARSVHDVAIDSVEAAFWSLLYAPTWDRGNSARDALVTSGRLELVRGEELRSRLASWQSVVEELRDNQLAVRTYVLEILTPHLSARGIPLVRIVPARVHPAAPPESQGPLPRPPLTPELIAVYRRTVEDPQFQALLAYRNFWEASSSRQIREVRDAAQRILTLLEQASPRAS